MRSAVTKKSVTKNTGVRSGMKSIAAKNTGNILASSAQTPRGLGVPET